MLELIFDRNRKNRKLKKNIEKFFIDVLKLTVESSQLAKIEDNFSGNIVYFLVKDKICGRRIGDYADIAARNNSVLYAICLFINEVLFQLVEIDDKRCLSKSLEYININAGKFLEDDEIGFLQSLCNAADRAHKISEKEKVKLAMENFLERIKPKSGGEK